VGKAFGSGEESQCGWLKDKYGLSWQIVADCAGRLMGDKDPEKAAGLCKLCCNEQIDIKKLQEAYRACIESERLRSAFLEKPEMKK